MCLGDLVSGAKKFIGVGDGRSISTAAMESLVPPLDKPPPLPDLSDELVQRAAVARRLRNMQGAGSTFLTGPLGLTMPAPTAVPGLGGA